MFGYGYGRSLSSVPRHLTAPNGLNFSRSIHNPSSRLNRVRDYLHMKGEATKAEIFRDVFGKVLDNTTRYPNRSHDMVTSGWGTYLFNYGVRHGFFKKVRRGNMWYWSNT
jgi:hypothetical protein